MNTQLRCLVTPGQFETEYAVSAKQTNGEVFSLFASKDLVTCPEEPTNDEPVDGELHVEIIEQHNGTVVIRLPHPSLEAGRFVTVNKTQLRPASQQV